MELGLENRRAVVAGASEGLGFACAQALAAEGVTVVIGSRSAERIEAAARRIGDRVIPLVTNLNSAQAGKDFVERAAQALGAHPEVVVANAGGPPKGNFEETPIEAYEEAFGQNMYSAIGMCQAAIPAMKEAGWGRVIAITSIGVKMPISYLILSNTTRSALTSFLKTLATEVAPHGVTVNNVMPGGHATDRIKKVYGENLDFSVIPGGRPGEPADFGAIVTFLASDRATYITGVSLPVDGGAYPGLL